MKKIFFCFAATAFIISCGNNKAEDANMPPQEKEMRDLIAKYPDSTLLTENLVEYFRNNNNYSQAIAETDKALLKDSTSERFWYMKAMLHSENDDTLKAIGAWEKIINLYPKPEYVMSLGSMYAVSKNPLALGMSAILMGNPATQYQGIFIQGFYYNNIGEKEKAIPYFDQCIKIDYTNLLAFREKAIAQYDLGKYEAALQTLELALSVKKDFDEAYYWLGRCYEKLGAKDDAAKAYQYALQINPGYVEAKDALGKMGIVNP